MKESQEESGYSDFLLQTDDGSARALRGIDTDTLVGMISTSTALRAGAILVYVTIYPSEMILLQFPPCTGLGTARTACIFYGASQTFTLRTEHFKDLMMRVDIYH